MVTETASGASASRAVLIITVMLATVMQTLDITIVNVALPHMEGALSANNDQIAWVLTSYMVAAAIFTPLTGYFTDRMGRKRFFLGSVALFTAASVLCALAQNIEQMVLFRLIQGVGGAALVPLSQAIMVENFPPEERGRAMAIWGMGVMVGPILGPTLGGYLTQHFDWRYIFLINLPVGIITFLIASLTMPTSKGRDIHTDWLGMGLLAVGIGGLQMVLDLGNQKDWFSSHFILASALACGVALFWFVLRAWGYKNSIVHLELFKDRNFAAANLIIGLFGLGLFGILAIQPLMLEQLLNYPVLTTGLVLAPRGIGTMLAMILVGRLVARHDPRKLIASGIVLAFLGVHFMTWYSLDIDPFWVVWPSLLQGFGMGMVFVPLSTVAFQTLPRETASEAAGIYSLIRTIGGSIGTSVMTTILSNQGQASWNQLGGHINPYNPALRDWLGQAGGDMNDPLTVHILANAVLHPQAQMLAFLDDFKVVSLSFLAMLGLIFFMQRPAHQRNGHTPLVE